MKIKKERKKAFDIADSGALSDLAFLLIVFFIVIAIFNINKGFLIGLPQRNSTRTVNTNDILRIYIESNGSLTVNNNSINTGMVETIITPAVNSNPNITVLLKISPDVDYQTVVSVIEIIRKLNVENFSFSMNTE